MHDTRADAAVSPKRRYEQGRRAEASDETRRRITEVTVALHDSVGPARTTVAEIARRAGVQRVTVYRHFPDDRSLFEACTNHWFAEHPPPDPAEMAAVEEPGERVYGGLALLYGYYRSSEMMFTHWLRDSELIPALAEFAETGYHGYLRTVSEALIPPDAGSEDARRTVLVAVQFPTWRLLGTREGLSDSESAQLMATVVGGLLR